MKWILVLSIVALAFTCHAKPENIPIEAVITNSDLVVVATLTDVKRQETNALVRCQGTLQVEEVLKGPPVATATVEWWLSIPPMEDASDHTGLAGKRGIWLLKHSGPNTYQADYYKRIQDVDKKDAIKKMIEKPSNKAPDTRR